MDWRRKFKALLDIKTKGFVSREYVFDAGDTTEGNSQSQILLGYK
jgi:hypothetical protein